MSACPVVFAFGSRHFADAGLVARVLGSVCGDDSGCAVWSGCAAGADRLALAWAVAVGRPSRRFVADWAGLGAAAGPRRSAELVGALPAGSRAVCFVHRPFPGAAAIVAAGGLRAWLRSVGAPGSACSVEFCRDAGVPVLVVFSCGRLVRPKKEAKPARTMSDDPMGLTTMPFGKHKGTKLMNVPRRYLEWLIGWENLGDELKARILKHLAVRAGEDAQKPQSWREREGVVMRDEEDLGADWRDLRAERLATRSDDPHPVEEGWDGTDPDYDTGFAPFGDVFEQDHQYKRDIVYKRVEPDLYGDDQLRHQDLLQTTKRPDKGNDMVICPGCGEPTRNLEGRCVECLGHEMEAQPW
jgi:hypothetical protein